MAAFRKTEREGWKGVKVKRGRSSILTRSNDRFRATYRLNLTRLVKIMRQNRY